MGEITSTTIGISNLASSRQLKVDNTFRWIPAPMYSCHVADSGSCCSGSLIAIRFQLPLILSLACSQSFLCLHRTKISIQCQTVVAYMCCLPTLTVSDTAELTSSFVLLYHLSFLNPLHSHLKKRAAVATILLNSSKSV